MKHGPIIQRDPIEVFRPWESEELKALRRRLVRARDLSAVRAIGTANGNARELFWYANSIANRWCFRPADLEELKDVADSLVRLFSVAATLERVEGEDGD